MGSTNHSKKNTTRHPLKSTKMAPPTMEKPQQAQQSDQEETGSNNSVEEVPRKEKKTKKKSKKSSALDQLPTGGVTDGVGETADNALSSVSNTLGSVGGQALNKQQGGDEEEESGGGGKSDTLRLRLDLNLDVEIQLKARIHGDLELALLTG